MASKHTVPPIPRSLLCCCRPHMQLLDFQLGAFIYIDGAIRTWNLTG
jgi:hypothetical protein